MIKYFLENPDHRLERRSAGASGYDLMADCSRDQIEISPGQRWLVSTGLYLDMPIGVEAQVRSRSGLSLDHGVIVLNAPGTIDSDYRGEVKVLLFNAGAERVRIVPGQRIAQLVFAPVIVPGIDWSFPMEPTRVSSRDELSWTERGSGGHGSTGL